MKKKLLLLFLMIVLLFAQSSEEKAKVTPYSGFTTNVSKNISKRNRNFRVKYEGSFNSIYGKLSSERFMKDISNDNDYLWMLIESYTYGCEYYDLKSTDIIFSNFRYRETKAQSKFVEQQAIKDVKGLKGNRVQKLKKIYNIVKEKFSYDYSYDKDTAYEGLKTGKTICQGYASYFYMLSKKAHIPCRIVTSKNHAWNIVKVGNYWYHVDTTWGDTSGGKEYFLLGSSLQKNPDHKIERYYWADMNEKYPIGKKDYK